jgi:transcriptional regulator with XRE-family HTH domain
MKQNEKAFAKKIGNRVLELRLELGWCQEGLEKASGIKKSVISDIENGKRNPRVDTLCRLAESMGFRITYFFSAKELDKFHIKRQPRGAKASLVQKAMQRLRKG